MHHAGNQYDDWYGTCGSTAGPFFHAPRCAGADPGRGRSVTGYGSIAPDPSDTI